MKSAVSACLFAALWAFPALAQAQQPAAQPPRPPMPAPNPDSNITSVEVQPNRRVTFRIWAPDATLVKLQAEGPEATP